MLPKLKVSQLYFNDIPYQFAFSHLEINGIGCNLYEITKDSTSKDYRKIDFNNEKQLCMFRKSYHGHFIYRINRWVDY